VNTTLGLEHVHNVHSQCEEAVLLKKWQLFDLCCIYLEMTCGDVNIVYVAF
jgi:hypothetical protein